MKRDTRSAIIITLMIVSTIIGVAVYGYMSGAWDVQMEWVPASER